MRVLTLLHHADVDAAFETASLAVASVVLGDGAATVEGTGEAGLPLHAAPGAHTHTHIRYTLFIYTNINYAKFTNDINCANKNVFAIYNKLVGCIQVGLE